MTEWPADAALTGVAAIKAANALEWLQAEYLADLLGDSIKRKRRPTESNYRRSVVQSRKAVKGFLTGAQKGHTSIDKALRDAWDRIEAQHVTAATLGRQRAGDLEDAHGLDELFGKTRADADYRYFERFRADVLKGRYGKGPDLDIDKVFDRASMYLDKARATANEAFAIASPFGSTFEWVMLAAEHCSVCPARAIGSPYTVADMPGWPGDGSTPCLTNCHCVIVRHDGVVGFARVNRDETSGGTHQVAVSGSNAYGPPGYAIRRKNAGKPS